MDKSGKALLRSRSRISALRKAMKTIIAILAPGPCKENACRGCGAEMTMAVAEAQEALKKDKEIS